MNPASETRTAWLQHLLSTEPADRERAQTAVREIYLEAGLDAPKHLLWFDSPQAVRPALIPLLAAYESTYMNAWARGVKLKIQPPAAGIRDQICEMLTAPSWEAAAAAIGKPIGHTPGAHNHLNLEISRRVSTLRRELYSAMSPRPRFDDSDELYRAERWYWCWNGGVLGSALGGAQIMAWAFCNLYSVSDMAQDEFKAGKEAPPAILEAAWAVTKSAGIWWAFDHAAILTERPAEIHTNERMLLHRAGGPAIVYRDGVKVFAWEGRYMLESWIMQPETISPSELRRAGQGVGFTEFTPSFLAYVQERLGTTEAKPKKKVKASSILKAELPANAEARLARLREHSGGALPFYERYLAGERQAVWAELIALGESVREDPYAADALAVAYETMQRVEANLRTVIARLKRIGYQFQTESMPDGSERPVHLPPKPGAQKLMRRLEKAAGGPVPLSLQAFYEVVGAVDLNGRHPSLSPRPCEVCPDPLVVEPLEVVVGVLREELEDGRILIAPDEVSKMGDAGGDGYAIEVPDLRVDGKLLNTPYGDNLFFVDYLRLCFRWGGFPGWKHAVGDAPPEIEGLSQGLVEF
jgi:hypothetical protein